jgi:hypothetical protein
MARLCSQRGGRIADARLSDRAVAEIVSEAARRVGLDSGPSSARLAICFPDLCRRTRRIYIQIAGTYVRDAELSRDRAGAGLP